MHQTTEVSQSLEKEIISVVERFLQQTMDIWPTSLQVNLLGNALLIMIEDITFSGQKMYALNLQSQELLDHYHSRIFDASKKTLESEIQIMLGRSVEHSTIRIEPVSRNGIIALLLKRLSPEIDEWRANTLGTLLPQNDNMEHTA